MSNREELLSQVESERESYEQQALSERGPDEVLATPNPGVIVLAEEGPYKFPLGLSGSLTKLTTGEDYLIAGSNIVLSTGSNGSVTISAAGASVGGSDTQVQFNDGGNALGGSSSFTFNKVTNTLSVTNLSGSLTKLSNGDDYLVAGRNISLSTGSSGEITIESTFQTWGTYTPVITGATTNPILPNDANLTATYLVQGKTMTLNFNLSSATTTGASSGVGTYMISMPSGYTIDTTYATPGTLGNTYNDGTSVGMSVLLADIAGAGGAWSVVPHSATQLVLIGQNPASATSSMMWGGSNFPLGIATNYRVSFIASIPLV